MTFAQYFKGLFQSIGGLIGGMRITIKELFAKKITQQYPENRSTLVISDRFRGELVMPHDENNEHACTACGICQSNCPNGTITVISKSIETEEGKKKKILDRYFYDLGMCTFCNLCVLTCPFKAIKFDNTFENAVFTHSKLKMQLNQEGSKLKEKKKPAPAPKPAAEKTEKPAAPVEKAEVKAEPVKAEETKLEKVKAEVAAKEAKPIEIKTADIPPVVSGEKSATEQKPAPEKRLDINNEPIDGEAELTHPPKSQIDDNPAAELPDEMKPAEPNKNVIIDDAGDCGCSDDTDKKNGEGKNKYRI